MALVVSRCRVRELMMVDVHVLRPFGHDVNEFMFISYLLPL